MFEFISTVKAGFEAQCFIQLKLCRHLSTSLLHISVVGWYSSWLEPGYLCE